MSAVFDSHAAPLRVPVPTPAPTRPAPLPAEVVPFPRPARPAARPRTRTQGRGTGLAVVAGIHVLFGWALVSGLAQHVVDAVRKPIDMAIIAETPPPPPPPPQLQKVVERPKAATPPPAYVPPPELVPAPAPPAPTIAATSVEPPREPVVAPPAPAPAPDKPAVVRQEISLACPGYQAALAQVLEDAIDRVGIAGTVHTRLTVRGGQVTEVAFLSGPREYTKYVQAAVKRMRCSAGGADEVQVPLDVNFAR
jgi:periplasmic protein TonB